MAGSFLDAFDKRQLKKITAVSRQVTVPEGWSPIAERTSADKLYVITSGEVSVRRHGEEIAQLGPGDVMGELAILGHTLRTASLVALTKLELMHFTDTAVEQLCSEVPAFKTALEAVAASHDK